MTEEKDHMMIEWGTYSVTMDTPIDYRAYKPMKILWKRLIQFVPILFPHRKASLVL